MALIPCPRVATICSSPYSIEPGWLSFSWVAVGESGIGSSLVVHIERCWGTEKGSRGVGMEIWFLSGVLSVCNMEVVFGLATHRGI